MLVDIEKEVFKNSKVKFDKLEEFGFKKDGKNYNYVKNIGDFNIQIKIDNQGKITGKIYDLLTNEEYVNFRNDVVQGEFNNKIKQIYIDLLFNIKQVCFIQENYSSNQANRISNYILQKYSILPELLWEDYPNYGVYRNKVNKKWFAIIININRNKLDKSIKLEDEAEIINLKINKDELETLLNKKGYYKAYHMNKSSWISIILDDTLKDSEIWFLIDKSYQIIAKATLK